LSRPLGATLLGAFHILLGAFTLVVGGLALLMGVVAPKPFMLFGIVGGYLMCALGVFLVVLGWGLLNLRFWAWALATFLYAAALPLSLLLRDYPTAAFSALTLAALIAEHSHYGALPPPSQALASDALEEPRRFVRRRR